MLKSVVADSGRTSALIFFSFLFFYSVFFYGCHTLISISGTSSQEEDER